MTKMRMVDSRLEDRHAGTTSDTLRYIAISALMLLTIVWPIWNFNDARWFAVNGPVEGPQIVYLMLATAIFAFSFRGAKPLTRLEICGITLFCFNLVVREADVRGPLEPYLGFLFAGGRIFYIVAVLWVPVVGVGLYRLKPTLRHLFTWLCMPAGIAMIVGGVLFVGGELAEKGLLSRAPNMSLEETLELYASFAIFLSACLTFWRRDGARAEP
jgi:hypothetical protein